MLKVMVVIQRRAGLSREEFLRHWCELHPKLVRSLPGVRGYRQNVSIEHRKEWPFDGIAELYFAELRDVALAFDGPEAVELFKHEEQFIGEVNWSIVDERDVFGVSAEGPGIETCP